MTSLPRALPPSLPLKGVHVQLLGCARHRRPAAKRRCLVHARGAPRSGGQGAIRMEKRAPGPRAAGRAAGVGRYLLLRTLNGVSPRVAAARSAFEVAGYVSGGGFCWRIRPPKPGAASWPRRLGGAAPRSSGRCASSRGAPFAVRRWAALAAAYGGRGVRRGRRHALVPWKKKGVCGFFSFLLCLEALPPIFFFLSGDRLAGHGDSWAPLVSPRIDDVKGAWPRRWRGLA